MNASSSSSGPVRVRFAPSPTGALHMGSALVALANAAHARATDGVLVLRIDDTDGTRSSQRDVDDLLRLLDWLDVRWDEGPILQSQRFEAHRAALELLVERGAAYPCFCGDARLDELRAEQVAAGLPPRYDGRCRALAPEEAQARLADGAPHVLRFAVPEGRDVEIDDLVHGRVVVPAGSFGDPVLCRADGSVGYLLASVVDDCELGITHVIRGEDHLSNTARQVLLFEAFADGRAASLPAFAHLPLLRDVDGRKLSKRDPLGTLDELADEGFLPVTVRRYLAELLGQGAVDLLPPSGDSAGIHFERVPTGAPRVDRARLESLGREDMAAMDPTPLLEEVGIEPSESSVVLARELAGASASRVALRGELRLVFDGPGVGDLPVVLRTLASEQDALQSIADVLERADLHLTRGAGESSEAEWASSFLAAYRSAGAADGLRAGELLKPLRLALTGGTGGPALDLVLSAIGAVEARRRIAVARSVTDELLAGR